MRSHARIVLKWVGILLGIAVCGCDNVSIEGLNCVMSADAGQVVMTGTVRCKSGSNDCWSSVYCAAYDSDFHTLCEARAEVDPVSTTNMAFRCSCVPSKGEFRYCTAEADVAGPGDRTDGGSRKPDAGSGSCNGVTCNGHGTCFAGGCFCDNGYDSRSKCGACAPNYTGYPLCTEVCSSCGGKDAGAMDSGRPDAAGGGVDAGLPDSGQANLCFGVSCSGYGTCIGGACTCNIGYSGPSCGQCTVGYSGFPNCQADPCSGVTDLEWAAWPLQAEIPTGYTIGADTVVDTVTGLTWQRGVPSTSYTWDNAKAYCLGIGPLDGIAGWRLPTKIELQSLVDFSRANLSINETAFPSTPSTSFWTATSYAGLIGYAWSVFFFNGTSAPYDKSDTYRVRCVH